MRTLPTLPRKIPHKHAQVLRFRGINLSDNFEIGSLNECKNICSKRYPYFTTRNGRSKVDEYSNVSAITHWNKLVAVVGTNLMYGDKVVGTVTAGDKQFAVVNTKLVIFPDKVYLDMTDETLHPLGAELSVSGAKFTESSLLKEGANFDKHFNVGDVVSISGSANESNNLTSIKVVGVTADAMTFDTRYLVPTETGETIKVERKVPDLDYICDSENRIFGVNNEEQTIYVSALGDPTNFYDYDLSTGSFSVAVGTEGKFTGCAKLQSSVLFFKEDCVHKLLGSYPAEYQLYSYKLDGVKEGCYKSLREINGTLFYMGLHGVCTYGGGTTSTIASAFGNHTYSDAVAGTDGDSYYLSCREGNAWNLFVYELKYGLWMREDETHALDFARSGDTLYMLDSDGDVMIADTHEPAKSIEWYMQFNPIWETVSGSYQSTSSIFAKKRYSKIIMRCEMPELSHATVKVRYDGGEWETIQELDGGWNNTKSIYIGINRCDRFEIRIEGDGEFTLLNMARYYIVGSDRP